MDFDFRVWYDIALHLLARFLFAVLIMSFDALWLAVFTGWMCLDGSPLRLTDADAGEARNSRHTADTNVTELWEAIHPGYNPLQKGLFYRLAPEVPLFKAMTTGFLASFFNHRACVGFNPVPGTTLSMALSNACSIGGTYDKYLWEPEILG